MCIDVYFYWGSGGTDALSSIQLSYALFLTHLLLLHPLSLYKMVLG